MKQVVKGAYEGRGGNVSVYTKAAWVNNPKKEIGESNPNNPLPAPMHHLAPRAQLCVKNRQTDSLVWLFLGILSLNPGVKGAGIILHITIQR